MLLALTNPQHRRGTLGTLESILAASIKSMVSCKPNRMPPTATNIELPTPSFNRADTPDYKPKSGFQFPDLVPYSQ
jgi:hypothetical protein